MATSRYWFGIKNDVWTSLEITDVVWNPYDYDSGSAPDRLKGWKVAKGDTIKQFLEVYNGANGAKIKLTIKVENDFTFTVETDPRKQAQDKIPNGTLIPVTSERQAPPVVYANLEPSWGDHGAVEYVVTHQADGFLSGNGDLDQKKYKQWMATIKPDYYSHNFFRSTIPVAVNPVDDRDEGPFLERYSTLRNTNVLFAKFLADTIAWETDKLGLSSNFFKTLPTPLGATPQLYQDDSWFANFFLRGPDPTTLELASDEMLPPSLSKQRRPALQDAGRLPRDFDQALKEGRVFHVDFSRYAEVKSPGRFASWPHAIFMSYEGDPPLHDGGKGGRRPTDDRSLHGVPGKTELRPIAIELIPPGQTGSPPVTVFAKNNDDASTRCTWELAKRVFLTAAANYHELGAHLARCHLVMERYALATYRHLPPWHPVGRLLRPHFKFMVATNNDAFNNLINPGGPVDRNFAANIDKLIEVSLGAFKTWDLGANGGIAADLKRRGLFSHEVKLPFWPYKEFGLKIYNSIQKFVSSYLRLWYAPDGAAYSADVALQNWRLALRDKYGAPSLMASNASFEDLVTACTNMIWTCGPQHSAVNYSQYDFLADAKTIPFGIQQEPGAKPFVPSRGQIGDQAEVISRLSLFRYDRLGVYSTASFLTEYGDLGNPNVAWKLVVDSFQADLDAVSQAMSPSIGDGLWGYRFLLPAEITNGISI
jgi:hypothetical protein